MIFSFLSNKIPCVWRSTRTSFHPLAANMSSMSRATLPLFPPAFNQRVAAREKLASTCAMSAHSAGHTERSTAAAELVSRNFQRALMDGSSTTGSSKVLVSYMTLSKSPTVWLIQLSNDTALLIRPAPTGSPPRTVIGALPAQIPVGLKTDRLPQCFRMRRFARTCRVMARPAPPTVMGIGKLQPCSVATTASHESVF